MAHALLGTDSVLQAEDVLQQLADDTAGVEKVIIPHVGAHHISHG
jgi:hypothetical protein